MSVWGQVASGRRLVAAASMVLVGFAGAVVPDSAARAASGDQIPGAAAFQWADQEVVFAPAADGSLHHWAWRSGQGTLDDSWQGGPIVGKQTGLAYDNQQHVFARSLNDTLLHWSWNSADNKVVAQDWGAEADSNPAGGAVAQWHQTHRAGRRFAADTRNHLPVDR
jgi:hypothetical protein